MSEKLIQIICPICKNQKKISTPKGLIGKKDSGATSVYVPTGLVCEHEFYAYIDNNFIARDYLILQFSLQDEAKKAEKIKNEVISGADSIKWEISKILAIISEKDLRSLIYACFLGNNLIFIEDDPTQERFVVLFNLLAIMFPEIIETANIFTPARYLEFTTKQQDSLQNHTVYNVIYKLSVYKPFGDSDAEPLEDLMSMLLKKPIKLQAIYAKNYIDYLRKFSNDIKDMEDEKIDKVIKFLKKSGDQHQEMYTSALIGVMRRRNESRIIHLKVEDSSEDDIVKMVRKKLEGKLLIYDESTYINQAENLPTLTGQHTLRLLRKNGTMLFEDLFEELSHISQVMSVNFEFHKLLDILTDFTESGYIESV